MTVNKQAILALEKSFQKIFTDALHGGDSSPMVSRMATRFPNTAAALDLSWIAAIPGMRKLVGTAVQQNLELVNWQVHNEEWEDTVVVKRKDIERDQLGIYTPLMTMLGGAAASQPDERLAEVLLAGFASKDYTGKNFFDLAKKHFPGSKASFDNKLTVELHPRTFEQARTMLKTMKIVFPDGSERKLKLGKDLVLVVGPHNESKGREILTAERNELGATNINRDQAKLEVWNEIGDGPQWFLFDQGYALKPFAFSDELPAELQGVTDLSDSHVLLRKEFIWQAYSRNNVGYMLPQLIVGSTGEDEYTEDSE